MEWPLGISCRMRGPKNMNITGMPAMPTAYPTSATTPKLAAVSPGVSSTQVPNREATTVATPHVGRGVITGDGVVLHALAATAPGVGHAHDQEGGAGDYQGHDAQSGVQHHQPSLVFNPGGSQPKRTTKNRRIVETLAATWRPDPIPAAGPPALGATVGGFWATVSLV